MLITFGFKTHFPAFLSLCKNENKVVFSPRSFADRQQRICGENGLYIASGNGRSHVPSVDGTCEHQRSFFKNQVCLNLFKIDKYLFIHTVVHLLVTIGVEI